MKRRQFLTASAAAAASATAASAAFPTPAIAQGVRQLKMVTTWPKNFPGLGTSPERIALKVREATEGAIDIKVFAGGELVPPFESFDAVSTGAADIYNGAEYYWVGKSKAFAFFTAVPFGMSASELNAWIYHGGGRALWDELSSQFNIKPFMSANTGTQWGGWFNREINTPEDLKGLKMRMPGLGGDALARLGANVQTLPGGEIFPALESGTIDATEWVGPWNDLAFGFYQVAKYYYWPGFHEPGAGLATAFNLDVWNSLTPSQQRSIEAICAWENDNTYTEFLYHNSVALNTLTQEHGVVLREFPEEVFDGFRRASAELMEEITSEDPFVKKVWESVQQTQRYTSEALRYADSAYLQRR